MNKPIENNSKRTIAQQVAAAARAFHQRQTGHWARSVTVAMSDDTLVITLNDALSPAEIAMSKTAEGAAQVQDYHHKLFATSADELRQEIRKITGVFVREAAVEMESATGVVVHAFTSGTMVQIFRLDGTISSETWSGPGKDS